MNVYSYPTKEEAQTACDQIWAKMVPDPEAKDKRADTKELVSQITVRWDEPREDLDGNWCVFIPEPKFVLQNQKEIPWNPIIYKYDDTGLIRVSPVSAEVPIDKP